VKELATLFRDHRDELFLAWETALRGARGIDDEYREVLESPVGARIVRTVVDGLVNLTQAEEYEKPGVIRAFESETYREAAGRARLGFELSGVVAALQLVRAAMWKVLRDAQVTGDVPAFGQTMEAMQQVDAFMDRLVQVEIKGYLGGGLIGDEDE
jgi:hypothetical protein